jgi:hypothetical protein
MIKVFHQKLCQRTLMDFDEIETHPIFLKTKICVVEL